MAHRPFTAAKGGSHRPARMAQRIKEELSLMVPGELADPRLDDLGSLTITEVSVTSDLKDATVKFALLQDAKRAKTVTACLNDAAGFLRNELRAKLDTKVTPILTFKYDKGLSNVMEIDALLNQARAKDSGIVTARKDEEE